MLHHEVEELVRHSIQMIGKTDGYTTAVRDIAYTLYRFQQKTVGGYPSPEVRSELEQMNVLFPFALDQLPEPARTAGLAIRTQGGYLDTPHETYVDEETGTAYVLLGSHLWEMLCHSGAIQGEGKMPAHELPFTDAVAQVVQMSIASNSSRAQGVRALWYACFPHFCHEDSATVQTLLHQLTAPETFLTANIVRKLPATKKELQSCDSFERMWLTPYVEWREKGQFDTEQLKQLMAQMMDLNAFQAVHQLAALLPDNEKLYYQCCASLSFYQMCARFIPVGESARDQLLAMTSGDLLPLPQVRDGFRLLSEKENGEDWSCRMNLSACLLLLEETENS